MISDFVGIQGDPGSLVGLTHIWDSGAAVEPRMEHLESKSTQPKVRDLFWLTLWDLGKPEFLHAPVDVVRTCAPADPDDVLAVLQEELLLLDLVLEDGVDAAVHEAAVGGVGDADGPDEALVDDLDPLGELGHRHVAEEGALVRVAEGARLHRRVVDHGPGCIQNSRCRTVFFRNTYGGVIIGGFAWDFCIKGKAVGQCCDKSTSK